MGVGGGFKFTNKILTYVIVLTTNLKTALTFYLAILTGIIFLKLRNKDSTHALFSIFVWNNIL